MSRVFVCHEEAEFPVQLGESFERRGPCGDGLADVGGIQQRVQTEGLATVFLHGALPHQSQDCVNDQVYIVLWVVFFCSRVRMEACFLEACFLSSRDASSKFVSSRLASFPRGMPHRGLLPRGLLLFLEGCLLETCRLEACFLSSKDATSRPASSLQTFDLIRFGCLVAPAVLRCIEPLLTGTGETAVFDDLAAALEDLAVDPKLLAYTGVSRECKRLRRGRPRVDALPQRALGFVQGAGGWFLLIWVVSLCAWATPSPLGEAGEGGLACANRLDFWKRLSCRRLHRWPQGPRWQGVQTKTIQQRRLALQSALLSAAGALDMTSIVQVLADTLRGIESGVGALKGVSTAVVAALQPQGEACKSLWLDKLLGAMTAAAEASKQTQFVARLVVATDGCQQWERHARKICGLSKNSMWC
jgi:hypothetical protein